MKIYKRIIKIIRTYDELLYGVGGKYCTLIKKDANDYKEINRQERIVLGYLKAIYKNPNILFPSDDLLIENGANAMDLDLLENMIVKIQE